MNTYKTQDEANRDKIQLETLLEAINASSSALRRDSAGLWVLQGSRGYCSTWGDNATWHLVVVPPSEISGRQWTAHKTRLGFAELTQDGDTEGCFRLHQLPSPEQAVVIRDILGIRKRVEFSPEEIIRRRELVSQWNA